MASLSLFMGITSFVLLLCITYAQRGRRTVRSAVIFRHLGLIVQQNLPMTKALGLAAQSESGTTRLILKRMTGHLETGLPLSEALQLSYSHCPALALSILRSAEQSGTLSGALCDLNHRLSVAPTRSQSQFAQRWLSLALILAAFVGVYGFVVVGLPIPSRVQTSIVDIFQNIGVQLPPLTQDVIDAMASPTLPPRTWLGQVFRLTWALLTLAVPILVVVMLARMSPRRADRIGIVSLVYDFVQWHVWGLRRIVQARGCADSLAVMRLALAAGWPMPEAIRRASEVDANTFWQKRLKAWGRAILDGGDTIGTGRELGLPETLLDYLAIGIRDNDPVPALSSAEEYYTCMVDRWRRQTLQVVWPLVTLYLGVIVGVFCMGIFQGIAAVVESYCRQVV